MNGETLTQENKIVGQDTVIQHDSATEEDDMLFRVEKLPDAEFERLCNFIDSMREKRAQRILNDAQRRALSICPTILDGKSILDGKKRRKAPAQPPKYQDPDNPENTWSGMGRQPEWYKQKIKQGLTAEQLKI